MHNYKVGDKVEILGRKEPPRSWARRCMPEDVSFLDASDELPNPDMAIWTPVTVDHVYHDEVVVFWADKENSWSVSADDIAQFLRPLVEKPIITISMATSCVECHTSFMYPVEHNCDEGRLCYGCKTTKAWKYTNLRG